MGERIGKTPEQAARIITLREQLQTHEGESVLVVRTRWSGVGGFGFGPTAGYDVLEEGFYLAIATPPFLVEEKDLLTVPTPRFALLERREARDRLSLEDGSLNRSFGSPTSSADLEVPIATRSRWSWRRFSLDSIPQLALEMVPGDQAIADWLQGLPKGGIQDDMLLVLHKLQRTLGKEVTLPETLTDRTEQLLEKRAVKILADFDNYKAQLWRISEAKYRIRRGIQKDLDEAVALGLHEDPGIVTRKKPFPLDVPQVVRSYAAGFGVSLRPQIPISEARSLLPEGDTSPV